MSYDLRAALHDLGEEERSAPAALPVAALRSRARRRRAGRLVVAGSVAAAAVVGIALVATGLPRPDGTPPPVGSPTWTPDAAGWPPAVTIDGPIPRCGEAMPEVAVPDTEPLVVVGPVTAAGDPLVAGGVLQLDEATITGPDGFAFSATPPALVAVRDGVVVATEDPGDTPAGVWYSPDPDLQAGRNRVEFGPELLDLVRCETQGRGPVALDPGTYDIYVMHLVVPQGSELAEPDARRTVVAGPVEVVLEAPYEEPTPDAP